MKCPKLTELPAPPPDKSGWPWTEETHRASPGVAVSNRISVVTPSYNQGEFLEETIRSVLLQGYSDLEYIVIDGGSSDQSVDIIRKYEKWLAYWVSEKDSGQTNAINKGFSRSTGEFRAYLNSDDVYLPDALSQAALSSTQQPETALLYADCELIDENSELTGSGLRRPLKSRSYCSVVTSPSRRRSGAHRHNKQPECLRSNCTMRLTTRCGCGWPGYIK